MRANRSLTTSTRSTRSRSRCLLATATRISVALTTAICSLTYATTQHLNRPPDSCTAPLPPRRSMVSPRSSTILWSKRLTLTLMFAWQSLFAFAFLRIRWETRTRPLDFVLPESHLLMTCSLQNTVVGCSMIRDTFGTREPTSMWADSTRPRKRTTDGRFFDPNATAAKGCRLALNVRPKMADNHRIRTEARWSGFTNEMSPHTR